MNRDLTGLVLAGGRSRRMGADKALIDVDGRPLVAHVARRLSTVCTTVLVAPGRRRIAGIPWRQVDDRVPSQGPLGGILGGLAVAATPLVAVTAVDMPELRPAVFVALAERWGGEPAVVPLVDGRLQPLHAIYARTALQPLAAMFDAGERSITRALVRLGAVTHDMAAGRWTANLNTADDLARYRSRS